MSRLLAAVILLSTPVPALAHRMLYHHLEVNLQDESVIEAYLTIHAPELPFAVAQGVDPAAVGDQWLQQRSESELKTLIIEARQLAQARFHLSCASSDRPLSHQFEFETPAQIRASNPDREAPPACLLASLRILNPGPSSPLRIQLDQTAEKRLLVVVNRPGEFPSTHDLDAGEVLEVELPVPPCVSRQKLTPSFLLWILVPVIFLASYLAIRQRNQRTSLS